MVAKDFRVVAKDKMSLPVMKISHIDRASLVESENIWLLGTFRSVAKEKMALPVWKLVARESWPHWF